MAAKRMISRKSLPDVSRMPVREALKRLDAEGLVQLANNRGASVTTHSTSEIGEMFDLRLLIEVDMFRRAIPGMTPAHFARCHDVLAEMEASYKADDVAKWGELNFAFHAALYAAAARSLTNELLQRVNLQCDRCVRMNLSVMKQRAPAMKEHRNLLLLAQEQKTEAACALLSAHITRTKTQSLAMVANNRAALGR